MTTLTNGLMIAAGIAALGNWVSVVRRRPTGIYVYKPLTLVLMIAAAVALDPRSSTQRTWFVIALVLSLAGDVFLMLPTDAFVPGLAAFLLGHIAYVVGLNQASEGNWWFALPIVLITGVLGTRLVRGIRVAGHSELVAPVVAYVLTILVMVSSAVASGNVVAAIGAVLFMVSDSFIGEDRFVRSRPWQPITIIVTYHVAQALLVISLTT
ncbi:MAG: lysoplasmalogenase [Acidimicrobiia bacterium]|nr:lysoplasmalogenase [Acidimicrobiia bacterium]